MVGNYAISPELLRYRQALPLYIKENMTRNRIRSFVETYGTDGVYLSVSGGKDSCVLLDIVRNMYPGIEAVFVDTWMEFPEIRNFIKQFDNVRILKPEKSLKQIINECGWCFPGKEVASAVKAARQGTPWAVRKLDGVNKNGMPSKYRERYVKWKVLIDAPFLISDQCCFEMKEKPLLQYEKESGKKPIVALLAEESQRRRIAYLRTGCNSFDGSRVMSKPLAFWTEQDILWYIVEHDIGIAPPYGNIIKGVDGKLKCTKEQRTGCMFCPVGCHLDGFGKYRRLKEYNQQLYDYCMHELGLNFVLKWIKENINCNTN